MEHGSSPLEVPRTGAGAPGTEGAAGPELPVTHDMMRQQFEKAPVCCPHCQKPLTAVIWASAAQESRMMITLKPEEGRRLGLDTVGGTMSAVETLLKAVGRDMGVKLQPMLEAVTSEPDGTVVIHILTAQVKPKSPPSGLSRSNHDE